LEIELSKPANNKAINVGTNIQSGPASLAQKQAWRRFWLKVISESEADQATEDNQKMSSSDRGGHEEVLNNSE